MADEYTDYLDGDYTPDLGSSVEVYIREPVGLVFTGETQSPFDGFILLVGDNTSTGLEGISYSVFQAPRLIFYAGITLTTLDLLVTLDDT